jgi:hypothetical protein
MKTIYLDFILFGTFVIKKIRKKIYSQGIKGDQEIRARFSNQKKNMKAANKNYEIWREFGKFSLVFIFFLV